MTRVQSGGTRAGGAALDRIADTLRGAPAARVAVLGGARLTNEAQYMWAKLAKGVIGTDNVDAQLDDGLDPELVLGLPRATIDDACRPGGAVVLIGPDLKEELGALYLRLRHAIVHDGVQLIEVTPGATSLSPLAQHSLHPPPRHNGSARPSVGAGNRSRGPAGRCQRGAPRGGTRLGRACRCCGGRVGRRAAGGAEYCRHGAGRRRCEHQVGFSGFGRRGRRHHGGVGPGVAG